MVRPCTKDGRRKTAKACSDAVTTRNKKKGEANNWLKIYGETEKDGGLE